VYLRVAGDESATPVIFALADMLARPPKTEIVPSSLCQITALDLGGAFW
jgi:hypothetical protein